jgi:hypothetical protein
MLYSGLKPTRGCPEPAPILSALASEVSCCGGGLEFSLSGKRFHRLPVTLFPGVRPGFWSAGIPPSSQFVQLLLAHLMGYFRNKNLAIAQINQGDDPVV